MEAGAGQEVRIGFDISQTGSNKAGCGYFAEALIFHLSELDSKNEYILYPTFGNHYWDPNWKKNTIKINKPNFYRGHSSNSLHEMQEFWNSLDPSKEKQLGNPDIIHANNFFCPKGLTKARIVYTLYDLGFLTYPEYTTEANRTACFDGVYTASLHSDYIIAISDYTMRSFLEFFPHFPPDRISVIYGASRFSHFEQSERPCTLPDIDPKKFWLNVGTFEPRKNHLGLLRAYALLKRKQGKTYPLVLAGAEGWLMDSFQRTIDELDLSQDVLRVGYTDNAALHWLFQNCFAFVFPSFFEGLGLPVIEAMSVGAPVIASATSSLPELLGNEGLLVDPNDVEDIYNAMSRLVEDEEFYQQYQSNMLERSKMFSWYRAANELLEIYQLVVNDLPPRCPNG